MLLFLFDVYFEHCAVFKYAGEVVADCEGRDACRCASVDKIAHTKGEKGGDVGNKLVDREKHLGGVALLL